MRFKWNLSLKSNLILVIIGGLCFALSINTVVLIYDASARYEIALLSKANGIGEIVLGEIKFSLNLNIPLPIIEGLNDKLKEIVSKDQDIDYSMVADLKGKVLFHNDISLIGKETSDKLVTDLQDTCRNVAFPIINIKNEPLGKLYMGMKKSSLNAQMYKLIYRAVCVSSIILLIGIIITWLLSSRIVSRLNHIIKGLNNSFQEVVTASEDVSASSQMLAEATSEQALNIEKISSMTEEFSLMTNLISMRKAQVKPTGLSSRPNPNLPI